MYSITQFQQSISKIIAENQTINARINEVKKYGFSVQVHHNATTVGTFTESNICYKIQIGAKSGKFSKAFFAVLNK